MQKEVEEALIFNPLHLRIASAEIGVKEIRGENHNPRILQYHQASALRATTDEVPWCSSFVSWVLEKSGYKATNNAMARSYLNWGISSSGDKGDIAVLWRGSPKSASGHVGFVIKKSLFKVSILGGNQNNEVCIQKYWRFMVLDYRRLGIGWNNGQ